jgi:hypothetical protein
MSLLRPSPRTRAKPSTRPIPSSAQQLVAAASRDAAACVAQAPESAACVYVRGVALGLEAREHPARANAILNDMLAAPWRVRRRSMRATTTQDPARVQALVWIRAPGWPLGPGDPERGLAAAQRAVALRPQHPPNWLALAEAQSKAGDAADARASYVRARDLAQAAPDSADRAEWLKQAQQGLSHLS